jgi:hypothetical protein
VLLIYFKKCPSFSTIQSYAPFVYKCLLYTNICTNK